MATAAWKNQAEDGHRAMPPASFFVGLDAGPAGWVAAGAGAAEERRQAAAAPRRRSQPAGTARRVPSKPNGKKVTATLYQIDGLDFSPTYLWLDDQHNGFAAVQGWSGLVREGFESASPTLHTKPRRKSSRRAAASLAKQLIHHPAGDLVIKNVSLFDSVNAKTVPAQRVTVRGERIVSVEAEQWPAARHRAHR